MLNTESGMMIDDSHSAVQMMTQEITQEEIALDQQSSKEAEPVDADADSDDYADDEEAFDDYVEEPTTNGNQVKTTSNEEYTEEYSEEQRPSRTGTDDDGKSLKEEPESV